MNDHTWATSRTVHRFLWWRVIDIRRYDHERIVTTCPLSTPWHRSEVASVRRRIVLGERGIRRATARAAA